MSELHDLDAASKAFGLVTKNYASTALAVVSAAAQNYKNDLDSLSELSETEALRLQMAMDRMSKFMTTLSNVLAKISDTDSAITQNLK